MPEGAANGYSVAVALIQLLGTLAWPGAILAALTLFRKDLQKLLPFAHLKYGDSEVSFRLEKAEEDVAALQPQAPQELPTPEEIRRFDEIANISPRAAILEQRRALEEAVLNRVRDETAHPSSGRMSMSAAVRILRKEEKIDAQTSALLDDLIAVGNAAAHGAEGFSKEEAERYQKLANQAINLLMYW